MIPPRRPGSRPALATFLLAIAIGVAGPGCEAEPPEARRFALMRAGSGEPHEPCLERAPLRRALFGDLHVHTTLSSDAWNYDVEVRPSDAYAYAFGEPVRLPPKDANGRGTREVRIDRPLDFAAVTDHAEFLGELALCRDPASEVYDAEACVALRASTAPADNPHSWTIMTPWPSRDEAVCGAQGERCAAAARSAWQEIIDAAERWNDRSAACRRTTFIGWEYTSHRLGSNLHRNVIFQGNRVPARPISYVDAPREWQLWSLLRDVCLRRDDCDVLAIPHNSNISNGRMFAVDYPDTNGRAAERERAKLRARIERVAEVMQHKGDSECRTEMAGVLGRADELCAFEKFEDLTWEADDPPGTCSDWLGDWRPRLGPSCLSHRSYVRYALTEGLAEERRLGVNPFKLGLIASTDTHNGLAGGVEERSFPGHLGIADADPLRQLSVERGQMGNMANGPGGIAGVWAEENSREAIFDALARREVFGTSGPRIEPRFFAAKKLPEDLCERPDRLELADRRGVPMGADLELAADDAGPVFAVFATADPGTPTAPGGDLQRIQVVKGWVDDAGRLHEEVVDVAGGPNGASVDPATCAPTGVGARELCGVWRDPEYDPALGAVYYARVLENPSCRYSAWRCLELPEAERPEGCRHERIPAVQQERAWTSPIWVRGGETS